MSEFLEQQAIQFPDLAVQYSEFNTFYTAKKWHQLTLCLVTFVSLPSNQRDGNANLVELYNKFVLKFDAKLNQLSLAKIAVKVCESYGESDMQSSQSLLEGLLENRTRLGIEASLYLDITHTKILLRRSLTPAVTLKASLTAQKTILDTLEGSNDPTCHSAYYKTACEYYKINGPPEVFYKYALMYLSYTNAETLSADESYNLATDLSLAALTGDGVYNFGEVVNTPILKSLIDTENAWLMELMVSFSNGDVNAFNAIMGRSSEKVRGCEALFNRLEFVNEKIKLAAVVNMVFDRSSGDRNLSFSEISARVQIPLTSVELLIMRAFSLSLLRGIMDEPSQLVTITWVLPRVLGMEQIKALNERLGEWGEKVKDMREFVIDNTPELQQVM